MTRGCGLTLPELLVVAAVIALTVAWAVPQWQASLEAVRAWTWQRELIGALERARARARIAGVTVTVCGGTPESGCADAGWSDGWLVFEDPADRGECRGVDARGRCAGHGGELLEVGRGVAAPLRVAGNRNVRGGVSYAPDRWAVGNGTFSLCRGARPLASVKIARTGRARRGGAEGAECPP